MPLLWSAQLPAAVTRRHPAATETDALLLPVRLESVADTRAAGRRLSVVPLEWNVRMDAVVGMLDVRVAGQPVEQHPQQMVVRACVCEQVRCVAIALLLRAVTWQLVQAGIVLSLCCSDDRAEPANAVPALLCCHRCGDCIDCDGVALTLGQAPAVAVCAELLPPKPGTTRWRKCQVPGCGAAYCRACVQHCSKATAGSNAPWRQALAEQRARGKRRPGAAAPTSALTHVHGSGESDYWLGDIDTPAGSASWSAWLCPACEVRTLALSVCMLVLPVRCSCACVHCPCA